MDRASWCHSRLTSSSRERYWRGAGNAVTVLPIDALPGAHIEMVDVPAVAAPPAPKRRLDGRRLRSERTRQLIIEAYLDLLRENPQPPTASQIAKRAGYSVRSVFERFEDLLALSLAAADHAFAQGMAQAVLRHADADRQTRLRSQVETRSGICERWLPLWRALLHNQRESELLKVRIEQMRDAVVARVRLMYRPELSTLVEAERDQIVMALEALTDFESWGRMRERHGLSIEAAREVWIMAIDRLLPPTPEASEVAAAES
jgi:AcrR family transcriptional regulator